MFPEKIAQLNENYQIEVTELRDRVNEEDLETIRQMRERMQDHHYILEQAGVQGRVVVGE